MNIRKVWLGLFVLGAVLALFGGCSSGGTGNSDGGSGSGSSIGSPGSGICEDSCPKACGQDGDCDTSTGQLCCDYGAGAKFCQGAKSCPKFCSSDSVCDTSMGQACVRTSLSNSQMVCELAQQGLKLCQADTDCTGATDVCCGIYKQGICTPANKCPKSCAADSECNNNQGEICCTSVGSEEPSLVAKGLCLNPATEPCLKACSTSADCNSSSTSPICCNGVCSATCPKACQQSSDCTGKICCKLPTSTSLGAPPHIFKVSPSCSGTPTFTTCAQCQSNGCRCPGCGAEAGAGFCSTNSTYSCSTCGGTYGCSSGRCAGCTAATGGACTGTPTYGTCASCPTVYCSSSSSTYCRGCTVSGASCTGTASCSYFSGSSTAGPACVALGCTFNATSYTCSGTPYQCSTFTTSTTCTGGCSWSTGTCSGTVTPCTLLADSTSCSGQSGCTWSTGACTGTFTSCTLLTDSTSCQGQAGCYWQSTGTSSCVGTITPCSQLTMNTCNSQLGCTVM
jgi:hypothetical protein